MALVEGPRTVRAHPETDEYASRSGISTAMTGDEIAAFVASGADTVGEMQRQGLWAAEGI